MLSASFWEPIFGKRRSYYRVILLNYFKEFSYNFISCKCYNYKNELNN